MNILILIIINFHIFFHCSCLGLKSPFIEFSNELEVLANNSIPLNITKDEQALMHQEGLRKLGTFIKPVDLRDSATGYVKADLTKKVYSPGSYGPQTQRRLHPIQEEMDQKQIILLDEDTDENGLPASLTDEDRKFIVPMALKNASPDPRWAQATFRGTTTTTSTTTRAPITTTNKQQQLQQQHQQQQQQRSTTPATPEFASNIEDLKKHILFLQNLTKHDSTFQSKFVVFPSLQKDKQRNSSSATTTTTTTRTPFRPIFQYSAPIIPPTRKTTLNINSKIPQVPPFGGYYHNQNEDDEDSLSQFFAPVNPRDKIAIVPQVLLLNDQNKDRNDKRKSFSILPLPTTTTTTTSTTATTTTTTTTTTTRRPTKPTKLPPCVRNPDSPKCVRQRKREELQRQRDREQLLREQEKYMPRYEPYLQTLNNTKRFAVSIEIPDSFKIPYNETESAKQRAVEENLQILSRFVRSTHKRRNIGGGLTGRSNEKFASKYGSSGAFLDRDAALSAANGRDFVLSNAEQFGMLPVNSSTPTTTVEPYSEPIDLNPDNCYQVDGMTYGQKKQCVLHTSVMPAISRGARAAIQVNKLNKSYALVSRIHFYDHLFDRNNVRLHQRYVGQMYV
uniref:Uncharacterized protein n=1 Tax=Glossina austeni TaxID=7395 RepID=A0A1A9UV90_GLOAU